MVGVFWFRNKRVVSMISCQWKSEILGLVSGSCWRLQLRPSSEGRLWLICPEREQGWWGESIAMNPLTSSVKVGVGGGKRREER